MRQNSLVSKWIKEQLDVSTVIGCYSSSLLHKVKLLKERWECLQNYISRQVVTGVERSSSRSSGASFSFYLNRRLISSVSSISGFTLEYKILITIIYWLVRPNSTLTWHAVSVCGLTSFSLLFHRSPPPLLLLPQSLYHKRNRILLIRFIVNVYNFNIPVFVAILQIQRFLKLRD